MDLKETPTQDHSLSSHDKHTFFSMLTSANENKLGYQRKHGKKLYHSSSWPNIGMNVLKLSAFTMFFHFPKVLFFTSRILLYRYLENKVVKLPPGAHILRGAHNNQLSIFDVSDRSLRNRSLVTGKYSVLIKVSELFPYSKSWNCFAYICMFITLRSPIVKAKQSWENNTYTHKTLPQQQKKPTEQLALLECIFVGWLFSLQTC